MEQVDVKVFASPDRKGLMTGMLRNSIARYALDSGQVSGAAVQQWLAAIERALGSGRYLMLLPQFVVSGRKPA